MKKLMKILTKTLYTVVCFLLLPCFTVSINGMTSIDDWHYNEIDYPEVGYVSLHIDYLGQKVKRSEVLELNVTVGVRNDLKDNGRHLTINFVARYGGERDLLLTASLNENETMYTEPDEFVQPGEYVSHSLHCYYLFLSEKFQQCSYPSTVDAFGEKAHLLHFKVDLMDGRFDIRESYKYDRKCLEASLTAVYDRDSTGKDMMMSSDIIYYAVDGDYIAFSAESLDDAERILYGDFGYFWKVTVPEYFDDLSDGCDEDKNIDY